MSSRSLGHRAPLLWLALPLMAGLAIGRMVETGRPAGWLTGAGILVVIAFLISKNPVGWAAALSGAMLLSGIASYTLHRRRLPDWDVKPPRETRLTLRIERTFPQTDARKATGLALIVRSEEPLRELEGQRIYFSLFQRKGAAPLIRTAEVTAIGLLAALPRNPPDNSFDGYLADAGINFRLQRGRVGREEKPATGYARFCFHVAERFKEILGFGIEKKRPRLAALLRAMMLGETHELTEEQLALFRDSGTMHLFAISGMNIAVIAGVLQSIVLLPLRRWKLLQFSLGVALLWLFVDITGAAPSAVRAFTMAVFLHGAFALWKPANVLAALTASAMFVLIVTPLQFFSASFVMSYGIVGALLLLGLPLGEAWTARWTPGADLPKITWRWWTHAMSSVWRWLAAALSVGASTTLVGLLTGVHYFGLLTPGALLTNLAIIPAASLVTLSGFGALVCGLLGWIGGASFCNHASAVALIGIEQTVRVSVKVPGAFVPAQFARPWLGGASLAILGACMIAGYALEWRRSCGGFWPPFVVVAAVLIFGVKLG